MKRFFPQLSTFQAVVTTDGYLSFAIFTYQCGKLNLNTPFNTDVGTIGFSASQTFFENHPLSQTNDINDIACVNLPGSEWSNLIYQISQGKNVFAQGDRRILSTFIFVCVSL